MAVSLAALGMLLAGNPLRAQQGNSLPVAPSVPALYFSKDPNPPPPDPTPPAASPAPAKSSISFVPRAFFPHKDTPDLPPAPQSLHFTKEATAVGPSASPPALRFTKDAAEPASPPPTTRDLGPSLHFTKEAPAPAAALNASPAAPRFAMQPAPLVPPPVREVRPYVPQDVVVRVAMQQPNPPPMPVSEEETPAIQLNPPGPQRVFRLESENAWRTRMDQEARQRGQQRVDFPPEPVVSTEFFKGRNYPKLTEVVEPGYVCYGRLFFEERNAERYDWDLGFMQPLVSVGYFYKDFLMLPYHMFTDPCRKFDCDAGYCLPGDPTPYLLYPPALSLTGAIAEVAAVVTVLAILP